jgi:RNA polymerase sigma-70 factor (ECF subfamily)
MLEDVILIYRFKRGSGKALERIYEKYRGYLLTLAVALLHDADEAEDVLHDFFVSFAQSADRLRIDGSLKWYMATCVANRCRDVKRSRKWKAVSMEVAGTMVSCGRAVESRVEINEELGLARDALAKLPYEQREVVVLHGSGEMKFAEIAKLQGVSIKTTQSRYRYGLSKLREILDGQV